MTKPWVSDAKQRASQKYLWVHLELAGQGIAPHLTPITPLPCFTVSYSADLDKRQRHLLHSREWKEGKLWALIICLWLYPLVTLMALNHPGLKKLTFPSDIIVATIVASVLDAIIFCTIMAWRLIWL